MKGPGVDIDLSPAIRNLARQLNGWGIVFVGWGLFRLTRADLSEIGFPIAMAIVGLSTLFIRSSAMLPVLAAMMAWAGLGNLTALSLPWSAIGVVQLIAAGYLLKTFSVYRHIRDRHVLDYYQTENPSLRLFSTEAIFPTLSATLSIGALLLTIIAIALAVGKIVGSLGQPPDLILESLMQYIWIAIPVEPLSVLGLSLGSSSLMAGNPRRLRATIGVIIGGILAVLMILIMLIPDSAFPPL